MQVLGGQHRGKVGDNGFIDEQADHGRRIDNDHEESRVRRISATVSAVDGPSVRSRRASRSTISALVGRLGKPVQLGAQVGRKRESLFGGSRLESRNRGFVDIPNLHKWHIATVYALVCS
ncbi:MAG TPA: hypothetical protein VFJ14_05985 [Nocardioidaceae bacterium]|nr:hypothetical protein [Nocardioidaceae bacterium]